LARVLGERVVSRPKVVWVLFAACLVLGGTGLVVMFATPDLVPARRPVSAQAAWGCVWSGIGAFVLFRRPGHRIGQLMFAVGASECVCAAMHGYGVFGRDNALPLADAVLAGAKLPGLLGYLIAMAVLPLLFPDGRLPSPRWRPTFLAVTAVDALFLSVLAVRFSAERPVQGLREPVVVAAGVGLGVSLAFCMISLVWRAHRADERERQQLTWLVWGLGLMTASVGVGIAVPPAYPLATLVVMLAVPVAAAVAILRHRLFDIDVLVDRSLVYAAVTGLLGGAYLGVLYVLTRVGVGSEVVTSLIAAGLVAVLFSPVRERVRESVRRVRRHPGVEGYAALARIGRRLMTAQQPDQMLERMLGERGNTLDLAYLAIEVDARRQSAALRAEWGKPVGAVHEVGLQWQGEAIGRLLACPGSHRDELSRAELELLDLFAGNAAVAGWAVQLSAGIRRSRDQHVLAREEERRRLRRDLHDDVGPRLAALVLKVDTIHNLLDRRREEVPRVLAELRADAQSATDSVRSIVYGLRPPGLDELGLRGAVQQQVDRINAIRSGSFLVTVDGDSVLPALPAAVEVAALRIIQEALTNTTRHAEARTCQIEIWCDPDLHVEIRDDGRGLPARITGGLGLRSMIERAQEVGGRCSIGHGPVGGTVVHAQLPLTPDAAFSLDGLRSETELVPRSVTAASSGS
jgi:signal transduction histidine kinase